MAGTYQGDADFVGVWYDGRYGGSGKKNSIKVDRVKDGIHLIIFYFEAKKEEDHSSHCDRSAKVVAQHGPLAASVFQKSGLRNFPECTARRGKA